MRCRVVGAGALKHEMARGLTYLWGILLAYPHDDEKSRSPVSEGRDPNCKLEKKKGRSRVGKAVLGRHTVPVDKPQRGEGPRGKTRVAI